MQLSTILLHTVAIIALLIRIKNLYKAINTKSNDKIKFEILVIILIIVIWGLIYYFLPLTKS